MGDPSARVFEVFLIVSQSVSHFKGLVYLLFFEINLEVEFLKPVVNTPPGVLLGNLIGIPRKRIHIRKSGQLLLYLLVNGVRSIKACPKK